MKLKNKKVDWEFYIQAIIVIVLAGILIYSYSGKVGSKSVGSEIRTVPASSIIPTGVPKVYGEELGITYDDVSPTDPKKADSTIRLLGNIDRVETLSEPELERYINILYYMENGIACEYCCGARSVIFSNGQPACGCAHSYAMRGLTKYLIKYHPEMSDEEILTEVGKWKVLFFPGILENKAQVMENYGINVDYINLTTNKYRGIEQGVKGGMVGAC
ncbi:MAG: hypothetical protein KatS3mg001_026 [Candidatus Pacearchaeota archaeon]|nr:MAG: hypothetical protein KatS3mg001_026 [Candidatus Pacearchaeota archaeon]